MVFLSMIFPPPEADRERERAVLRPTWPSSDIRKI
jgi:hypothetical protein